MKRNLATSLRCRTGNGAMDRYDRLPRELRQWVAGAALPWSARSVLKLWDRLHHECGADVQVMWQRLDLAEERMLAKDATHIWGADYPMSGKPRLV